MKKRQHKKDKKKKHKRAEVYSDEEEDIPAAHAVDIIQEEMPEVKTTTDVILAYDVIDNVIISCVSTMLLSIISVIF